MYSLGAWERDLKPELREYHRRQANPPIALGEWFIKSVVSHQTPVPCVNRADWPPPAEIETMPKQKTHKGTKKRFRLTATGKVKHRGAGTSHLAFRKSSKRKRNLRGTRVLGKQFTKNITKALNKNSN